MLEGENGMLDTLMPILSQPMNMMRMGARHKKVKAFETTGGGRTSGSRNVCLISGLTDVSKLDPDWKTKDGILSAYCSIEIINIYSHNFHSHKSRVKIHNTKNNVTLKV